MPNLSTALALYEFSIYRETNKISGRAFYFDSTSTSQTYIIRMPIGTKVKVDGIWYDGADDTNIVINVTHTGTIEFIESVPGCITYFKANSNGITSTIQDLSANTDLQYFSCAGNTMIGSIPSLSSNTTLQVFYCYSNRLTGSIPSLSNNIELTSFMCQSNRLTGNIPSLSTNTKLVSFYCSGNQLTGSIPDLSSNILLYSFQCQYNNISGNIPDLSTNTRLSKFYCYDNNIIGDIPDLSTNTFAYFQCQNNQLTGFAGGTIKVTNLFKASNNLLTIDAVDAILQALVDGSTVNATIKLETGNGVPTNTTAIDTLRSNGCTVTVEGGY